jgi:hypothetical protein
MPLKWRKQWVSDETFESVGIFDVNGDGMPDIVSGGFWYPGPDFRKKHNIGPVAKYGEYYDDFSTIAMDVNGDGRPDFITGGWWGGTLRWRENPPDPAKEWPLHDIARTGNIETTRAWDLDGDGILEIFPNTPGENRVRLFKLKTVDGKGIGEFEGIVVFEFPEGAKQGHGHGAGDIAGNGRMDLVLRNGWLEQPSEGIRGSWRWHPEFDLGVASNPILVVDVNGDGLNDLIVGGAHNYGLDWYEQRLENGKRTWLRHPIDPFHSQYHDLQWADIDGDGQCELVTGKRHRAHCGNDLGEWDDYGIYYFKWNGESFTKIVVDYGAFGFSKGVGIQFALADLRGSGRLDLVAPGKDGLFVYFNEGAERR